MKKLFPDVADVPPNVANRAARIIEKHLRIHHVSRTRDLPEDARIRLYRDLRFFFDSGSQPPEAGDGRFSIRKIFSRMWEKVEDFLSAAEIAPICGAAGVIAWIYLGEQARVATIPGQIGSPMCKQTG